MSSGMTFLWFYRQLDVRDHKAYIKCVSISMVHFYCLGRNRSIGPFKLVDSNLHWVTHYDFERMSQMPAQLTDYHCIWVYLSHYHAKCLLLNRGFGWSQLASSNGRLRKWKGNKSPWIVVIKEAIHFWCLQKKGFKDSSVPVHWLWPWQLRHTWPSWGGKACTSRQLKVGWCVPCSESSDQKNWANTRNPGSVLDIGHNKRTDQCSA